MLVAIAGRGKAGELASISARYKPTGFIEIGYHATHLDATDHEDFSGPVSWAAAEVFGHQLLSLIETCSLEAHVSGQPYEVLRAVGSHAPSFVDLIYQTEMAPRETLSISFESVVVRAFAKGLVLLARTRMEDEI